MGIASKANTKYVVLFVHFFFCSSLDCSCPWGDLYYLAPGPSMPLQAEELDWSLSVVDLGERLECLHEVWIE